MNTLNQLKQDYNEIVEIMSNYTFSLQSLKELNDYLHRTGHDTLIEINGEPIDEIESIKESDIKWIRLDDYNNLNYIYFNKGWQTNEAENVIFDAYVGIGNYFIENININELDKKYLEIIGIAELSQIIAEGKSPVGDYNNKLAYNKEKAEDLFTVTGANSPVAASIICYDNSIAYSMENVKYPTNKIEEIFVTPENIAAFAESDNWQYRREAAWSDAASPEILEKLAKDPDESVRQAVAVNRNTPLEVLKQLCEDEDIDVRNYAKETVNDVFLYSGKKEEFEKAKNYITDYLQTEYSSEADFSNLFHIGIGYTEIGSEEQGDYPFQVEANLVDCEINYYIDGEIAKTEKYDSLAQMNECRLSCLDFDDFLHIGTTEFDRIFEEKSAVTTVLAVSQCDTNRYYIANNVTENEVRKAISNSDKLFMDLCALGNKQIDEAAFAKYSQTQGVSAIDVNIDEKTMHIYDAEKPVVSFNEIRNSDYIKRLDDVIDTCRKIKEALINGDISFDRDKKVNIDFEVR